MKYIPRNDIVLLRKQKITARDSGLVMPDQADEGWAVFVEAVGPKVKELKPGDRVMALASEAGGMARVHGERDLWITREDNIMLVLENS